MAVEVEYQVINNFATDQPIFTIGFSSQRVLLKELIAGVAKFCVVVRSMYTACVTTVLLQLFFLLFALLYIVDCV